MKLFNQTRKQWSYFGIAVLSTLTASAQKPEKSLKKPNILIIMVDDMGYSDIGCYGGEIMTPNIDHLASEGLRYTQFYNTGKCHSSRISLLTGRYPYQAGNYSLENSVTIAETLRSNGYFTAMAGKWHLDGEPTDFGFDRYFGHLSGATNFFTGDNTFRLNGNKWEVPETGFYTTIAFTDYSVRFLEEARDSGKPWLMYIAHNAPHFPLHCLKEDYDLYDGVYEAGWDDLRDERVKKMKSMGLFDESTIVPGRPDHVPPWESLSDQRKKTEVIRMTAFAAMVDRVDRELGRLLNNIKEAGEMENTFILFVSDNGACPFERSQKTHLPPWNPESDWHPGTGWSWLSNTPFRLYKQNQFEGGVATPAVVHWPKGNGIAPGSIIRDPIHFIDILPTLAEITNSSVPDKWEGRELNPVAGISFAPTFKGETLPERELYFLFAEDRAMRMGPWKLVSFRSHPWELYNLDQDPTEIFDLADRHPDIALDLEQRWHRIARDVDNAPLRQRNILSPSEVFKIHPLWTDYAEEELVPLRDNSENIIRIQKVYE